MDENKGHGHVHERPDGVKARCGGPGICSVCALEMAQADSLLQHTAAGTPYTIHHHDSKTDPIEKGNVDIEALSARLHDVYQKEAHRRHDVRHSDAYENLSDDTKEWDRVLARWIVEHWRPTFDPSEGMPPA